MKQLSLFLFLTWSFLAQENFAQEKIDLGPLKGGGYQVLMPANWNKKLVMYAHGYQFMGSPAASANAGRLRIIRFRALRWRKVWMPRRSCGRRSSRKWANPILLL
jgi:hypothetical protein